jgi:hypothetical protein
MMKRTPARCLDRREISASRKRQLTRHSSTTCRPFRALSRCLCKSYRATRPLLAFAG